MPRTRPDSETLIDESITRRIIGAFFECYNHLGYGQFESVYRKALLHEMRLRELDASEECSFEVRYKGVLVGVFRPDLLVENRTVVEVKSTPALCAADRRQLSNYLRVTGLEVGLLLHFGPEPRFERRINAELFHSRKPPRDDDQAREAHPNKVPASPANEDPTRNDQASSGESG
jgi:GxxExxY protein